MRLPGERWRAPYACDPAREPRPAASRRSPSPTRSEFQRDRDRIIHSSAFRRLKHKTQVFVFHEGDHFRTRLTHTIEVSQIARALARSLGLDEDLAEALALSHDLGHTPFGHTGEDALDACMEPYGGFDHNAQALRIVTRLERRYAAFDGLNLAWETLEGLVKHNGPLLEPQRRADAALRRARHPRRDPGLRRPADPPARQLRRRGGAGGGASPTTSPTTPTTSTTACAPACSRSRTFGRCRSWPSFWTRSTGSIPGLETARRIHELTRRVITRFVEDAVAESGRRLAALAPRDADDVRARRRAGRRLLAGDGGGRPRRSRTSSIPTCTATPA